MDAFFGRRCSGPLAHLKPTTENKYAMQLSVYRYILEEWYQMDIQKSELVVFSSSAEGTYFTLEPPYLKEEAQKIIGFPPLVPPSVNDRDAAISFDEPTHTYTVRDLGVLQSVTAVISQYFPEFNADAAIRSMRAGKRWGKHHAHWGKTDECIKESWQMAGERASAAGSALHNAIELSYTQSSPVDQVPGYAAFEKYKHANPETPVRVELPIYAGSVAGTPDMVFKMSDGSGCKLVDWKYSKKALTAQLFGALPNC